MNEVLTIQGEEVLARVDGCRALTKLENAFVEGLTAPYFDPITNLCHVAANEPAKPPEAA